MRKSIEIIWKEGFMKSDALIAPKVNDLYNQKSNNIIDKMIRMMRVNVIALVVFALAMLIYTVIIEIPIAIGVFVFLLFVAPAIYTKKQMEKVEEIDKNVSSYQYLKMFDHWLKDQISRNVMLSRFFYPTCILAASLIMWFSDGSGPLMEELLMKYPDLLLIWGVPFYFIIGVLVASSLMAIFAEKIYRWDLGIVYGRVFRKLEEIIADMEELRE